jgi:proteasome assembly chaperone 2
LEAKGARLWSFNSGHPYWWYVSSLVVQAVLLTPVQPRKQEFVDALFQFLQESRLSAILFLSGVDMSNRTDAQMVFVTFKSFSAISLALIVFPKHAHVSHSPIKFPVLG